MLLLLLLVLCVGGKEWFAVKPFIDDLFKMLVSNYLFCKVFCRADLIVTSYYLK